MTESDDAPLRDAWRRLQAQRGGEGADRLPLERIRELAEQPSITAADYTDLDLVLADPVMRAEYETLRTVARAQPAPPRAWWPPLAAAAAVVLAAGALLLMRARTPAAPEPMRGDSADVELVGTTTEAITGADVTFVWRTVPGAERYVLELVDGEAEPLLAISTSDTTHRIAALPADVQAWSVTAHLRDGRVLRPVSRPLTPRD